MRPIFNVPGEGTYAFIMGIISGYPIGAKIVAKFKEDNICSSEECERLLAFTNNSGPMFIISTVGISFLGDTKTGLLLFITHILACLSVGFCFRFWKKETYKFNVSKKNIELLKKHLNQEGLSISNLGNILSNSIVKSVNSLIMIGGFVVLFSIIISSLSARTYYF